ncbi:MAG: helix-turn-helix domain-containing protein [Chloroflexota bacterium]
MFGEQSTESEQLETVYLKIADAAKLMRVSERTLYRWIRKDGLRNFRVGNVTRIALDDLKQFIAKNTKSKEQ